MDKIFKAAIVVSVIVFAISWFFKKSFPPEQVLLPQLRNDPVQTKTEQEPFEVKTKENTFTITPLFDYELYGMVVTFHHSKSIYDNTHKRWGDFLNAKDICVIWGDNIKDSIYQKFQFTSGTWTCYWRTYDQAAWSAFSQKHISNNHLLAEDKALSKVIMNARRGDQIYMKGHLVKYSHDGGFTRGTSTTRDDTGEGACEVVFVTEFKILKKANVIWNILNTLSLIVLIGALVLWGITGLQDPRGKR